MNQKLYRCFLALALCASAIIKPIAIKSQEITKSTHEKQIDITINLGETQSILKSTLSVSLDNPHAQLGNISYSSNATKKYLPELLSTKEVFSNALTMQVPVKTSIDSPVSGHLHTSFLLLPQGTMTEKVIAFSFNQKEENAQASNDDQPFAPRPSSGQVSEKKSLTQSLQHLVQTTDSNWIRFLFALLLGLLLSLTPCIYPMIPITIGILHHNEKRSILYNFLGSLCYAFGLSTTFACLGLLAAFAGASFGGLLSQPIFVIVLTLFIGYMSLTMIGVIDLTIPSFLQKSVQVNSKFGPFLSAYLFGLISGSVASPCVSPGLALLLTIVATMGNIIAGFLLLFMFGMGMSIPLIIIGTFSSSMQTLPRAGQWMVEIKKALGFIMLATCFYYLSNILPALVVTMLFISYLLFAALFYIIDAQKEMAQETKTIKSLLGIVLLAAAVFFTFKAYENSGAKNNVENGVAWASSYEQALEMAQAENKLVLLDFWANHCTICKAIDKKLFHKDLVAKALDKNIVFVKVDCTSSSNQEANYLKNKFSVFAQPAILIINPGTQEVIKKWSSEPYSMTPQEFIQAVKNV
ncbi:MAG: thioredoxin family protein [Candidatus Dependentiae bacterium]|nr:thioredoxin family protein [Candidatus Dependentiae bacterium]